MAGGYSVLNALNRNTRQQAQERPGARFRTRDINIADIYPNENNFYAMQDIEALAEDIKAVGLIENLAVKYAPKDGKNYKLLGGERRWRALSLLVEQGYTEFAEATCQIRTAEGEHAEVLEIIMCNRQRVKTVWEQIEEETRLKETLQSMKKNGETLKGYNLQEGRLRDTIAAILNYSAAKIGQMETIAKNLRPELQEALKDEKINFSTAYTVAKMDEAGQQAALEAYQRQGELNSAQAKQAEGEAKGQRAEEPPEDLPEKPIINPPVLPEYGEGQMNVESICYRCAHWGECYQKSETTVKCATFKDKEKKEKERKEQQEETKPRIVDGETGEIYETMKEAEQAAKEEQERTAKEQEKERTHYIRIASTYYKDVAEGRKTFELRKNDRDYRIGDILEMAEFKEGRNTGRTIRSRVVYMQQDTAGLADGYCVMGTKVLQADGYMYDAESERTEHEA